LDGVEWIPRDVHLPQLLSDATLAVMARSQRSVTISTCRCNTPAAAVLKRMRRGGNRQSWKKLLDRARRFVPDIALRTTSSSDSRETEEDFEELMSFARDVEFDRVGVFTYSDEEDTVGHELGDKVSASVMRQRRAKLMRPAGPDFKTSQQGSDRKAVQALLEGVSQESETVVAGPIGIAGAGGRWARVDHDAPEGFAGRPGDFIEIEITEAPSTTWWRVLF